MWFTWLCNSCVYFCLNIPMPKLAFAREANNLIFSQQMPRILLLSMLAALFSIPPDKKYSRISLSRFQMSPVSTCWRHNARFLERKMHHKSYFASFAIRLPFKSWILGNSQGSVLDLCNIRSIKVREANDDNNKHYVTYQGSRDKNIDKHPICYQQQMFKTWEYGGRIANR